MSLLRIGIDASGLVAAKPATGLQRYTASLLTHLVHHITDLQFHLYFSYPVPPEAQAPGTVLSHMLPSAHVHWRTAPVARGWQRLGMGIAMQLDRLDVFHFPAPLMSGYCPVPAVVTFHDLAALSIEADKTEKERRYLEDALEAGRRAAALIAVSQSTCNEICHHLGRTDAVIIPEGVDLARFKPDVPDIEAVRQKYQLDRYILCAGTIQARKNHIRLIQAFERLADQIPHHLVIAGADGSGAEALNEYLAAHPNPRVRRIGYIPEPELPALYAGADLLALPSLWEGFGLPLLEAMASGTPVLTSDVSALAEVAGNAAVIVDSRDIQSIADGLQRALTDELLRRRLIEAGHKRVLHFSWDSAAQRTIEVYRTAARRQKERTTSP